LLAFAVKFAQVPLLEFNRVPLGQLTHLPLVWLKYGEDESLQLIHLVPLKYGVYIGQTLSLELWVLFGEITFGFAIGFVAL